MSRECLRSRNISAPCDGCGVRPEVVHMPTKLKGWYCVACCPACAPTPEPAEVEQAIAAARVKQLPLLGIGGD